jgi:spore maturation protein CgeB
VDVLPGVPTIGVFEALACGIPLVVGGWRDSEGLFSAGHDHLVAANGREMARHMRMLLRDTDARRELARNGRERVLAKHTCAHRVDELVEIARVLETRGTAPPPIQRATA